MNLSFSTISLVYFKRPSNADEENSPHFSTHQDVYQTSQEMCSGEHIEIELGAGGPLTQYGGDWTSSWLFLCQAEATD